MKKNSLLSVFLIVFLLLLAFPTFGNQILQIKTAVGSTSDTSHLLAAFTLPVSNSHVTLTDTRTSIEIPIIMYHGITKSADEESEYFISQFRFENDLKWYKQNGYTTVLPSQLIDYVENGRKLPTKPIMLSFDDGYANNYAYAFPLLEKYNMKAVISLIGVDSDIASDDIYRVPENCNLSWGEVSIMAKSGLIEFGNHTYDLHHIKDGRKGADKKTGETSADYRKLLADDLSLNNSKIKAFTGVSPLMFAWPYGAYPQDENTDDILKSVGIKMSVNSYQHTSTVEQGNANSLYGLGRYLRTPKFSLESITE